MINIEKKYLFTLNLFLNCLCGAIFFAGLIIATELNTNSGQTLTLTLPALTATFWQVGRLFGSFIVSRQQLTIKINFLIVVLSIVLANVFFKLASFLGQPFLVLLGMALGGLSHIIANVELRSLATTHQTKWSLVSLSVFFNLGWLGGILYMGIISNQIIQNLITVLVSIILLLLIIRNVKSDPKRLFTDHSVKNESSEQHGNRLMIYFIIAGAFINSAQITIFNSSFIILFQKNLGINNDKISLLLIPVFLPGLLMVIPRLKDFITSSFRIEQWFACQILRLLLITIILWMTSIYGLLPLLPLFGILMNLGLFYQLQLIKESIEIGRRKGTIVKAEIAMVIGGFFISFLSWLKLSNLVQITTVGIVMIMWILFFFYQKRRFIAQFKLYRSV